MFRAWCSALGLPCLVFRALCRHTVFGRQACIPGFSCPQFACHAVVPARNSLAMRLCLPAIFINYRNRAFYIVISIKTSLFLSKLVCYSRHFDNFFRIKSTFYRNPTLNYRVSIKYQDFLSKLAQNCLISIKHEIRLLYSKLRNIAQ